MFINNNTLIYFWIVIILFLILYFFKIKNKDWDKNLFLNNYYKKRYFFTPTENAFYRQLYKIIFNIWKDRFVVFSKVRVSDLIWTDKIHRKSWKKINPRHFDFVICDIDKDFEPIIILELDWYSHKNDSNVRIRDGFKDEICNYIKLPLLRITKDYTDEELKELLNKYL